MRDNCKRRKLWSAYKKYRNRAKQLIRVAKRNYLIDSVMNSKDTRTIWQNFRKVNNKNNCSNSTLPDITINDERYTSSEDIASKLNHYFANISQIFGNNEGEELDANFDYLENFINSKVPNDVQFKIPNITPEQVSTIINDLDSSKAMGLDGLGPRILKSISCAVSPSLADLINKSLATGCFPDRLNSLWYFLYLKAANNYRPISILPTISKIFERHINKHLMAYLNKYSLIHESQSGFRP